MKIELPRGTHDILPSEQPLWRRVTTEMERVCALYGYHQIQTPVFEDAQLFSRTSGVGSDIVQKEMYYLENRKGEARYALRPEATAPICRAYIEHGMKQQPQPVKLYTLATFYRYDRPQRGRHREHYQLSVECVGSVEPAVDVEVIELYDTVIRNLGVTRYELRLNSIGDRQCRPAYIQTLSNWLDNANLLAHPEVQQKRATNPLRVFDVKDPAVREALEQAPKITDHLCEACSEHFEGVRTALDAAGVGYTIDPTVVRGLDYYSRTAWEFLGPDESSQASTISGGGRYDYLIEQIGGPPTPGVGFGAGLERLLLALQLEGISAEAPRLNFFVIGEDRRATSRLLAELRRHRKSADMDYIGRSRSAQIKLAQRLNAERFALVEGDVVTVREEFKPDQEFPFDEHIAERLVNLPPV